MIRLKKSGSSSEGLKLEMNDYEQRSGGVGGWEVLPRPRQTAATGWLGFPEETLTLPVILNGIQAQGADRPVERTMRQIRKWAQKQKSTGEPPALEVHGLPSVPKTHRWVIQTLEPGVYETNAAGRIVRQELTLGLLRYVEPKIVSSPAKKANDQQLHSAPFNGGN